jgi:hypothetical protein
MIKLQQQTQTEMHTELEIVKEQQHGTKAVLTMIIINPMISSLLNYCCESFADAHL